METFSIGYLDNLHHLINGPGHFRFFIQPAVALLLGLRDGRLDVKAGHAPFLYLIFRSKIGRWPLIKEGLHQILTPIVIAIVLDGLMQYLLYNKIFIMYAVVTGTLLMATPYSISRGLSNRVTHWIQRTPIPHPTG